MNSNPLFRQSPEAAREAGRKRWQHPEARQAFGDNKRGFHVPPDLMETYRHLRKYVTAPEAGRMLGLAVSPSTFKTRVRV